MVEKNVDVLLVGAGAMSATLAVLLKQLDPSLKIAMLERLDAVAGESTSGWNNAGTGHAAYCELNYTPRQADGSINADKAYEINEAFETTLQFWSHLVEQGALPAPGKFINPTPHCSFVWGDDNVSYLRSRFETLKQHHMFEDMEYSEDPHIISTWLPLVMNGRDAEEQVAATRVSYGTDVNFGALTRYMVDYLQTQENFGLFLNHQVEDLLQNDDKSWTVYYTDTKKGVRETINAGFVFLGAGGGALHMLQKSGIREADGYGGFPVGGQWLVCTKPGIVHRHLAKVYGKPPIGSPPMSVPHLDTRIIDGQHALLFGPFAGFTTKFLKQGSIFDLIKSLRPHNLLPMLAVGRDNIPLIKYLITEVMHSHDSRVESLRAYYPEVDGNDWKLAKAGQRVQIIKKDPRRSGKIEFGTEVVCSADNTLAALLGASPGASTVVQTMVKLVENCFPRQLESREWQARMREIVPSYKQSLIDDAELLRNTRKRTLHTLELLSTDNYYDDAIQAYGA